VYLLWYVVFQLRCRCNVPVSGSILNYKVVSFKSEGRFLKWAKMQVKALSPRIAHLDHTSATSIWATFLIVVFVGSHRKWFFFLQENSENESIQATEPSFACFELDSGTSRFLLELTDVIASY
jgi:hypothetical protein